MHFPIIIKNIPIIIIIIISIMVFEWFRLPWWYHSMNDLDAWGERLKRQGGGGRNCSYTSDEDIYKAAKVSNSVIALRDNATNLMFKQRLNFQEIKACFQMASNRAFSLDNSIKMVSGVWRCERGEVIGEFQLSIYKDSIYGYAGTDFCSFAVFYKDLQIPLGAATENTKP